MPMLLGTDTRDRENQIRRANVDSAPFKILVQSQSLVENKKVIATLARNHRVFGAPTDELARLSMENAISERLRNQNTLELNPYRIEKLTPTTLDTVEEAREFVGEYLTSIGMDGHFKDVLLGCHNLKFRDLTGFVPFGLSYMAIPPEINSSPKEAKLPVFVHELAHALSPKISIYSQSEPKLGTPASSACIKSGAVYSGVKNDSLHRSTKRFKIPEEMLAVALEGVFFDRRPESGVSSEVNSIISYRELKSVCPVAYEAIGKNPLLKPKNIYTRIKEIFIPPPIHFGFWDRLREVFDPTCTVTEGKLIEFWIDKNAHRVALSYPHIQVALNVIREKLFPGDFLSVGRDKICKYLFQNLWSDNPKRFYSEMSEIFGPEVVKFLAFGSPSAGIETLLFFKPEIFGIVDPKTQKAIRKSLVERFERTHP
jgi:hypothetical protein